MTDDNKIRLSPRVAEILFLIQNGTSKRKEISKKLGISYFRVRELCQKTVRMLGLEKFEDLLNVEIKLCEDNEQYLLRQRKELEQELKPIVIALLYYNDRSRIVEDEVNRAIEKRIYINKRLKENRLVAKQIENKLIRVEQNIKALSKNEYLKGSYYTISRRSKVLSDCNPAL